MAEMDLVHRCQAGDQAAWTALFEAHRDRVFRAAILITRHRQDAHDVTQDVFIRLIKAIHQYDPERGSFETWLYAIVVNLSRDHLRRRKRMPTPWTLLDGDAHLAERSQQPEQVSLTREWQQSIWDAVGELGERHRTAVILHYYVGLSCLEIAHVLSCAEGTVHSRLYYARQFLEKRLGQEAQGLAWATVGGLGR